MIYLLTLCFAATPVASLERLFADALRYDRPAFRYLAPDAAEQSAARELVTALARLASEPAAIDACRDMARRVGLALTFARDRAGDVWTLHEPLAKRAGSGFYAFRQGGSRWCVQAPHAFFDQGTGEIALAVFAAVRGQSLFTNTVHRYTPSPSGERGAIDVAHAEGTLFLAATEGLLAATTPAVVQLHGFGDTEGLAPDIAAVVSNGSARPPATGLAARVRGALARQLAPERVLLYGVDADVLGATTNIEGRRVRAAHGEFVHIEMSGALRRRLLANDAEPLAAALREALQP